MCEAKQSKLECLEYKVKWLLTLEVVNFCSYIAMLLF